MKKLFTNFRDSVYMIHDSVANYPIGFVIARSDGEAVRKALLSLRVPIRDSQLYHIGTFDPQGFANFQALKTIRLVSWEKYKLPESVSEALAPLGTSPDELREIVESVQKKCEE